MPLSPPRSEKSSPEKTRQPVGDLRFRASKIELFENGMPSIVSHVRISAVVGLWSSPSEEAAQANRRFGQVGPGIDACQLSQTAKLLARALRTGSCSRE